MNDANPSEDNARSGRSPKADLEMKYIDEYLLDRGYSINELGTLSEEESTRLMAEASQYASLKLAELESRARISAEIHNASDFS
jgi:hypothetical protein